MKYTITTVLVVALFAVPASAERLLLGSAIMSEFGDDETDLDFSMNGFGFSVLQFNNQNNLFYGFHAAMLEGEDSVCEDEICIDYELNSRAVDIELGITFYNRVTPFASATFATSETDFSITGMESATESTDDTVFGVGAYWGDQNRRFKLSFTDIENDPSVSFGGYFAFHGKFLVSAIYSTPSDNPMDSWGINLGIGRSF